MKLKAFRIQNFRSIIDTGFQDLSPDNITVIIGQNESGKTSILEALSAFDTDEVTEDDLRNDDTKPIVTCIFQLVKGEIEEIFEDEHIIPENLKKVIDKLDNCVAIQKTWDANRLDDPDLEIENGKLKKYFADQQRKAEEAKTAEAEGQAKKPGGTVEDTVQTEDIPPEEPTKELINSANFAIGVFENAPVVTLFEDNSLLPPTIDVADLETENKEVDGYIGALNFLELTGLKVVDLANHQTNARLIGDRIDSANRRISEDFQKFWSQILGATDKISLHMEIKNYDDSHVDKVGKPYISFWIKDNNGKQRPMQRSKGVRWFISFFLTLKATAKTSNNRLILIDEPGSNLHAKAQQDILKILESEKENLQIMFATHSPYLLDISKVYRVLAVERKEVDDNRSITTVYKFHDLGSASSDTLFPLYTNMGVDISHQQVIQKNNNVLLEEPSAHFYMKSFWKLFKKKKSINFLPATGCSNVPLLANLLIGWGIEFIVLLDDDSAGRKVYNELKNNGIVNEAKLIKNKNCAGIEDMFERDDFTKIVLNDSSESIPENTKVSQYVKDKRKSKPIIARDFLIRVEKKEISKKDFSVETQARIKALLEKMLKSI